MRDLTKLRADRVKIVLETNQLRTDINREQLDYQRDSAALTFVRKEKTEMSKSKQKLHTEMAKLRAEIEKKKSTPYR